MRGFLFLQCVLAEHQFGRFGSGFIGKASTWMKEPSWEDEPLETVSVKYVPSESESMDNLSEIDQIKSTYRLPLNDAGEPAHIPIHNHFEINLSGLKESDKNEEGYFEYRFV